MKIDFQDKSYIIIEKSNDKIIISVGAVSQENPLSLIVNTINLSKEDFKNLIADLGINE